MALTPAAEITPEHFDHRWAVTTLPQAYTFCHRLLSAVSS
jgi:hypothetical protein